MTPFRLSAPTAFAAVLGLALAACTPAPTEPEAAAPGAPRVSVAKLEDLPAPLPRPYDEGASAEQIDRVIDAAFARAQENGKRVVVDMGGNWCGWCRSLAGVMELPEVKPFIEQSFELVFVPVSSQQGLTDQNLQVLERFGIERIGGVPWLVVAEPDGTVLASSYEVTDENHETPQAMVNWLAQWAQHGSTSATGT